MKLTNRTKPQARNYQCNKCKAIHSHIEMYDDDLCYNCWEEKQKAEDLI